MAYPRTAWLTLSKYTFSGSPQIENIGGDGECGEKGGMCIIRSSVQGSDTLPKKHHSSGYNLNSAMAFKVF